MKDHKIDPFTGKPVNATEFAAWVEEVGLPFIQGHGITFLKEVDRLVWLAYRRGWSDAMSQYHPSEPQAEVDVEHDH